MRRLTALGVLLVLLLPVASADRFTGSFAADGIYIQGPTSATSPALLTRLGGQDTSFEAPPTIALAAERIVVEQDSKHFVYIDGVEIERVNPLAPSGTALADAVATFESWLPTRSDMVVTTRRGSPLSQGTVSGDALGPTPLLVTESALQWAVGSRGDGEVRLQKAHEYSVEAGWLLFQGREFARKVDYSGDFVIELYGADVRINHDRGVAGYESGHRVKYTGPASESWLNVTTLHVYSGQLTIAPGPNAIAAYAPSADLSGLGSLLLQEATGLLRSDERGSTGIDGQDMNLVGQYQLSVRGSTRGLLAAVAGDFESSLLGFAAAKANVAGAAGSWWWLVVAVGLVAAGGTGGVLLVRRRQRPAPVAPVVAVTAPPKAAVMVAPKVAEHQPDLAWQEINEEFGVVHAGERSGVLIVLVPEPRVEPFVHAVVARGLMAEDTGDRIHAGENTLAVIALEPSPLMMN